MWHHFFPLLFPKDSESLKILDIQLREVGAKRPLNSTSKSEQTHRQTHIWTNRLIENIGPEGWWYKSLEKCLEINQHFGTWPIFKCELLSWLWSDCLLLTSHWKLMIITQDPLTYFQLLLNLVTLAPSEYWNNYFMASSTVKCNDTAVCCMPIPPPPLLFC